MINTYENTSLFKDLFKGVDIEINTTCNRRCPCCPNSIFDRGLIENEKLMPIVLFQKIIDELAEIGFSGRISPHHFGEPLLDKRLFDLMDYVRKRLPRAEIIIFTNGDYLTSDKYLELVSVGVDGFIVTQHDRTVPAGIKELCRYFKSSDPLPVPIQYLIIDESTPLDNDGGLINVSITNPLPPCMRYPPTIIIDHEGNVVQCCIDYLSNYPFGNVKNDKLQDIWCSERYTNHRKNIRKMKFCSPLCKLCVDNIDPAEMKKAYISVKIHNREIPDGETFFYDPIELEKLEKIPDTTGFSVELVKSDKYKENSEPVLIIGGWAVDSIACAPAAAVFITIDIGQEFRAYYPVTRPDVAAHFSNEVLQDSGFVAIIPSGELLLGKRTFKLKIVTHDRRGYYYPPEEFSFENTS